MVTSTAVPVEEYLRTTYDPDKEYVAGQLVDRHVGEYYHSFLQNALGAELRQRGRVRGFRAFTEQRVRVSDEPRYRIPDLCVKAVPHEITSVLVQPDLVVEIVSPDDDPVDLLEKVADYQAAGIPYIWVADPYRRSLIEADRVSIHKPASLVLATPLVGEIDFAVFFAELDEPMK
jgi:Uma2 family endonuclease